MRADSLSIPPAERGRSAVSYLEHLGTRHEANPSKSAGGHAWQLLDLRRATYEKVLDRAEKGLCGSRSALLAAFLPAEIRGLERSQRLSLSLNLQLRRHRPAGRESTHLFAGIVDLEAEQRRGLLGRLGHFLARDLTLLRLCSWRLDLAERRLEAIWRWLHAASPADGELTLPVFFLPDKSARPSRDVKSWPLAHSAYLGIWAEGERSHRWLYLRFDDDLDIDFLRVKRTGSQSTSARTKISTLTLRVEKKALRDFSVRTLLEPLLDAFQTDLGRYRRQMAALARDKRFRALGGEFVPPLEQGRPIAMRQGNTCSLKNHSRGVNARIERFLGRRRDPAGLEAAGELWQVLKSEERAVARATYGGDGGREPGGGARGTHLRL